MEEAVKKAGWAMCLDDKYGKDGAMGGAGLDAKAHVVFIGETLRNLRIEANLTQTQLAEKIGTKKTYISRIENGRADMQLSTFYKLIEKGFSKKLEFLIQ